jgi:hypothetical protein
MNSDINSGIAELYDQAEEQSSIVRGDISSRIFP